MFHEILNIDIQDAIEEVYRMGKTLNSKRPLVLELNSKKMIKYIMTNKIYFRGTQIFVSEFLDENSRKERRKLRSEMIDARKQGLHAVIRRNKLYIEGKKINLAEYSAKIITTNINEESTDKDSQQKINEKHNKIHTFRHHAPNN